MQVEFEFGVIHKDPNSFLINWPSYATKLKNLMKVEYKAQMFVSKWPSEIEDLLILLKLLPAKANGKNGVASAANFRDSIAKFIVFSDVIFFNSSTQSNHTFTHDTFDAIFQLYVNLYSVLYRKMVCLI